VCIVVFGFNATPKVAGVTSADNGMHLEIDVSNEEVL
jgi:hypothetical protein